MGKIIQFRPRKKEISQNRVEAMMKGQLEEYICNTCGKNFEVLFDNKPERCPHCNRIIEWS